MAFLAVPWRGDKRAKTTVTGASPDACPSVENLPRFPIHQILYLNGTRLNATEILEKFLWNK